MSVRKTVDTLLAIGLLGAAIVMALRQRAPTGPEPVGDLCAVPGVPREACAAVMTVCQEVSDAFGGCPRILSIEARVWPDSSLGCPQPGMLYAPVQIPGWRIVVEVEGRPIAYHTDQMGRLVVRC